MGSPDFRIIKIMVNVLTSCSWHDHKVKILLQNFVPLPERGEIFPYLHLEFPGPRWEHQFSVEL